MLDDTQHLVTELLALWRESGIGPSELAQKAGIDRTTLHHWQTGGRAPNLATLQRVAKALGHRIEITKAD